MQGKRNIAVDAFPLTERTPTGISIYLKNILKNLLLIDKTNKFFLYSKNPINIIHKNQNMDFDVSAKKYVKSYENTMWLFSKGAQMMKKDEIDIFWGTRHMIPPWFPEKIKTVLTVHDIVWHYYPETMSTYNRLIMKLMAKYSIRKADRIIAVSKTTADSLVKVMGIPDEKISVIHNAADQYKPVAKEKASAYITEKYNVVPNYILTLLTIEPRKNLELLFRVFSVLKVKKTNLQLVVAGASGWKNSYLKKEYRRLNLTEKEIIFLGYVPEEDIAYLYSGASMFLFPSRYEGFGIPPLEAMTCGTPVISSNVFSLPEVIGDAGILLDPDDIEGWVETIIKVVSDETKREYMRRKGIERARLFSWKTAAEKTLKVFESLY